MIIDGAITILCSEERITIEIYDRDASIQFVEVHMSPTQWAQALSRLSHTSCEKVEVKGLEKVGRKMEHKSFEFEMPEDAGYNNSKEVAAKIVKILCPEGWTPSIYFNSQGSFFSKDDKRYARTTINRWVEKE